MRDVMIIDLTGASPLTYEVLIQLLIERGEAAQWQIQWQIGIDRMSELKRLRDAVGRPLCLPPATEHPTDGWSCLGFPVVVTKQLTSAQEPANA